MAVIEDLSVKTCCDCYALFTGPGPRCPGCQRRETERRAAAWLVTCIEQAVLVMADGPTRRNLSAALTEARERGVL